MDHLGFSGLPSYEAEQVFGIPEDEVDSLATGKTVGEDTEEIEMDPHVLWQRILNDMSDEEL